MAERNGAWLAAMLPTDAQLDVWTNAATLFSSDPYESSYPFGVKNLKGIVR